MKQAVETYRVTIFAARTNTDRNTEKEWSTNVTINGGDPITEVADRAHEKFYEKHGDNWDIFDTHEKLVG